jgi:hypothetical protein
VETFACLTDRVNGQTLLHCCNPIQMGMAGTAGGVEAAEFGVTSAIGLIAV